MDFCQSYRSFKLTNANRLLNPFRLYGCFGIFMVLNFELMQNLESYALNHFWFESSFHFRHVDDILLCEPKNLVNYIRDVFNTYNKH